MKIRAQKARSGNRDDTVRRRYEEDKAMEHLFSKLFAQLTAAAVHHEKESQQDQLYRIPIGKSETTPERYVSN